MPKLPLYPPLNLSPYTAIFPSSFLTHALFPLPPTSSFFPLNLTPYCPVFSKPFTCSFHNSKILPSSPFTSHSFLTHTFSLSSFLALLALLLYNCLLHLTIEYHHFSYLTINTNYSHYMSL